MDIVQMSISASVLILIIVIIRALTLHKLPKKTFIVLWGVAVCRLLIPFSISSNFSFYTMVDMLQYMFSEKVEVPASTTISNNQNIKYLTDMEQTIGPVVKTPLISQIKFIWIVGICLCGLLFIISYLKCYKEFKMSLPVENAFASSWLKENSLQRPIQIRQSDRIRAPLTYGVFSPVILVPKETNWTDETQLRYILTHEFVHIKYFDSLTKLILTVAVCLHWFNPFVWVMYILANRDIELSCDEMVVGILGETMKSEYALTLIGLEEKKSRLSPLVNNFSKNAIEERVVSIMKTKKISRVRIIMALILVVFTTMFFGTSASNLVKNFERSKIISLKYITVEEDGFPIDSDSILYKLENQISKIKTKKNINYLVINDPDKLNEYLCFNVVLPSYLPEGYKFNRAELYVDDNEIVDTKYIDIYFVNKETGKYLYMQQSLASEETAYSASTGGKLEQMQVNGINVLIARERNVFWENNDALYSLHGRGEVNKDELIKIVESF